MKPILPLSMMPPYKEAVLVSFSGGRGLRARLMNMGLHSGVRLKVLHCGGRGNCTVVLVGNTRLMLGHGIAQKILVKEE
jgi:ferrous iron transport protein A